MKKIIIALISLIVLSFAGYFVYVNYLKEEIPKIIPEKEVANITEYYIYGNHLNIKGNIELDDFNYTSFVLTLHSKKDKDIELKTEEDGRSINFYLSEYINDGLYLDDIERGTYNLFLKLTYPNKEKPEEEIVKYYSLQNNTTYNETEYYTLSKYNNKITINTDKDYQTLTLNVKEKDDNLDVYDITIDPGHGGMDGGGSYNGYKETDFTIDIAEKVKEKLEASGLKIKLTHSKGELSRNDLLDEYGENGRAVIPNKVKSKYTFSIHINKNEASSVHGVEVYTPSDINYDLAKSLAENIVNYTGVDYSSNRLYKMYNGVYTHNFTEYEISSSIEDYQKKNYEPYEITEKSNYLYMIRETGGFMTGAYVDDRNSEKVGINPYYNSNVGNETYLMELCYLSNIDDTNILKEKIDEFATAIADAIKTHLNI